MEERKTRPVPDKAKHWKQLNESRYLGHFDLPPKGQSVKVKIKEIQQEEVFNPETLKKEWKNVLIFEGTTKAMILNRKENPSRIASHYGDNFRDWIGKEIELERGVDRGKECVRVKAKSKSEQAVESVK